MLRDLQSFITNVDATEKAGAKMKRGAFVAKDEGKKVFSVADGVEEVYVVDRDTKLTMELAMGVAVSEYDDTQDTILKGEGAGLIALQRGVRKATSEYTVADSDATAGKYLTVKSGKLIKSDAKTTIKSLGFIDDNGHKLLGFEIVG